MPGQDTIEAGEFVQLEVTVDPEIANVPELTWESSDPEVAEVTGKGLVRGKRKGTVTISAGDGKLSGNVEVEVINPGEVWIDVKSADTEKGSASGSGWYKVGENVEISASENEGFIFVRWNDENTDNPRTITVEGAKEYIAEFDIAGQPTDEIWYTSTDGNIVQPVNMTGLPIPIGEGYDYFGANIVSNTYNDKGIIKFDGIPKYIIMAFKNSLLKSINIPEGVKKIDTMAFIDSSLRSVKLPDTLTIIGDNVFANNSELEYFIIPKNVIEIGWGAILNCKNLEYVKLYATVPPYIYEEMFQETNYPIYVPAESVDNYKTATNWIEYADRIFPIQD